MVGVRGLSGEGQRAASPSAFGAPSCGRCCHLDPAVTWDAGEASAPSSAARLTLQVSPVAPRGSNVLSEDKLIFLELQLPQHGSASQG